MTRQVKKPRGEWEVRPNLVPIREGCCALQEMAQRVSWTQTPGRSTFPVSAGKCHKGKTGRVNMERREKNSPEIINT